MTSRTELSTQVSLPSRREILLERTFRAPRALVFDAWTKPEHLARWWGPGGFTLPRCEIDLRPGGRYVFVMRAPNGQEFPVVGSYREVVRPERLVYTSRCQAPGFPDFEGLVTVTFDERGDGTLLRLRAAYANQEQRDTMLQLHLDEGFSESFVRLDAALAAPAPAGRKEAP